LPRGNFGVSCAIIRETAKVDGPSTIESCSCDEGHSIAPKEAIRGLHPENRFLMLTSKPNWHPIFRRDVWLSGCHHGKPSIEMCSFSSSNYCCRDDVDGCSYAAFEGIARRWLVIEDDQLTLEQQFWILKRLSRRHGNLGCVCHSGNRSLHGWFFVEGWSQEECFALYAEAVRVGHSRHQRIAGLSASETAGGIELEDEPETGDLRVELMKVLLRSNNNVTTW
jgi:hypothetical protein